MVSYAAIAGGAASLVGGVGSLVSSNKAKKARRKAAKLQNQRQFNREQENILQSIRETRIQRAASLAASVASGAEYTSAAAGAYGSLGSQFTHNLSTYLTDARLSREIGKLSGQAERYDYQGSLYNSLGSLGVSMMKSFSNQKEPAEIESTAVNRTGYYNITPYPQGQSVVFNTNYKGIV